MQEDLYVMFNRELIIIKFSDIMYIDIRFLPRRDPNGVRNRISTKTPNFEKEWYPSQ